MNFCTLDLSSFYFDIRKDVLYCDSIKLKKRKDCVVVLNIILECLLKWFAPILVFTTDEIHSLGKVKIKKLFMNSTFPKYQMNGKMKFRMKNGQNFFKIKQNANIAIEEKKEQIKKLAQV